jgi:hypothetical protein
MAPECAQKFGPRQCQSFGFSLDTAHNEAIVRQI